jgi:hypothetical protein
MRTFKDWRIKEDYTPIDLHTISGAEGQIRTLAAHIRSSFVYRPNSPWLEYRDQILKAGELLNQAADLIGQNMDGTTRNTPWDTP